MGRGADLDVHQGGLDDFALFRAVADLGLVAGTLTLRR
jgi:hypothetical protein